MPFERPDQFAGREFVTDEEFTQRAARHRGFRRVDANTVRYDVTVEDPATFARPWTARLSLKTDTRLAQVPEYACHEGNYAMTNILAGARAEERVSE